MTRTLAVLLCCIPTAITAQEPPPDTLLLDGALHRALAQYPSLSAAQAEADGARAAARQLVAERWPQLSTRATLTRFQEPMVVAPFHAFDPTQPPQFDRTLFQGSVDLRYTVFDGGTRGARIAAARADARAAGARTDAARQALVADVVDAYLDVLTASAQLLAQEEGVRALSAERQRVSQLLAQGRAAQVDLLRVDAALAQAEAARAAAENHLTLSRHHLARFVSDAAPSQPLPLRPVRLLTTVIPARDEAIGQAESASPVLEQARERLAAGAAAKRAAGAQWFPRIELVGGYLGFGAGSGDFTAEWQGGVRLSYPLFTGGARSGAGAEAAAREAAAAEGLRLATLQLHDQVDRALASIADADATTAALAAAVEHLTEVVRIEQLRLETGAGIQVDYLREEADLRRVRAQLAAAAHGAIAARVELARLTGLLSLDWLHRTVEHTP